MESGRNAGKDWQNEVVLMSGVAEILYKDMRATLMQQLVTLAGQNNLNEAFVAWLISEQVIGLTVSGPAHVAAGHVGAERTYQDVAILGFASAASMISSDQITLLNDGLKWLAGREPFLDGSPTGFCLDAISLLGVALGTKNVGDATTKKAIIDWMNKFVGKCYGMRGISDLQRCLYVAAQGAVDDISSLAVPKELSIADVHVALRSKGLLPITVKAENDQDEVDALMLLKREAYVDIDHVRAALRLAAFDWIYRSVPSLTLSHPTTDELCQLLRRVPAGLRRWTWEEVAHTRGATARKWHIDNEYHVQNILWLLLAPIFPDLNDEEYTPPIGQLQPRADICIPSLQLIIEIKFMRPNKAPKDLIEEIAADSNLYLATGSKYKAIVAFIWDDSRRTEEHDMLIKGLRQINGITDAIVVSRPGTMIEDGK
jgi:hypothetical protein